MTFVLLFVASQVIALPTSKLAWDVVATDKPTHYEVRYNTDEFVNVGTPPVVDGAYVVSLPVLAAGTHTVEVRACNVLPTDPSVKECASAAPVSFTLQLAPQPCADIPSVFVTRWEHTTGKPGSRMRVNFQPASVSPITEIEAKINGQVVARIAGSDLRDTAGVWLTTPAAGVYKLTVWAKNAAGCTREVFAPVDLVV